QYASEIAQPSNGDYTGSLNPDPAYPKFGHWSTFGSVMRNTASFVDSGGEVHGPTNVTYTTNDGPPIVNDFLFRDPNNGNVLTNAFNRPTNPYNAMTWACPAPSDWDVQSSNTATYVGDVWPRYNKSFSSGSYAVTTWNFLNGTNPAYSADHNK